MPPIIGATRYKVTCISDEEPTVNVVPPHMLASCIAGLLRNRGGMATFEVEALNG